MRACCAARGPSSKTIRSPHFMYGMVSEDSTIEAQRTYRALLSASTGGSLMKDHAAHRHPVLTSGTAVQRLRASTHLPSKHCSQEVS